MESNEKLNVIAEVGSENAEALYGLIGKLAGGLINIDANQDGKVSLLEGGNLVQTVVFQAIGLFSGGTDELKQQLAEHWSNPEIREDWMTRLKNDFDIINDEAEELIEDWLDHVNQTITLIQKTTGFFKKDEAEDPIS